MMKCVRIKKLPVHSILNKSFDKLRLAKVSFYFKQKKSCPLYNILVSYYYYYQFIFSTSDLTLVYLGYCIIQGGKICVNIAMSA